MVVELRKRKEKAAPVEAVSKKMTKKTEKRKAPEDASPVAVKKLKAISKVVEKPKKSKAPKAKKVVLEEKEEEEAAWSGVEEGDEVDAETQALVKALDSGNEDETEDFGTYKKGQDVGKAPKASSSAKKVISSSKPEDRGTIYVGHIPFGFFEHQMREYFEQFGDVTRIRLSRNKKTGASKHYGFIEFADAEVAEIVAKTMDKYLLFGCILSVRVVPAAQIHSDLWKGANRRWKPFDRNAAQGRQLAARDGESHWNERVAKEEARRAKRAEKLKELGYEFEAPKLKAAVAQETPAIEDGEQEPVKAIEAPLAEEKSEEKEAEPEKAEEAEEEVTEKPAAKKAKGGKKGAKGKKVKS